MELVVTGTCTVKVTVQIPQHWVRRFLTMDWAAVVVIWSSVSMILSGASLDPWSSPQPISARRTLICQVTMEGGATHLSNILTWLSQLSCILLNTRLGLCLYLLEGNSRVIWSFVNILDFNSGRCCRSCVWLYFGLGVPYDVICTFLRITHNPKYNYMLDAYN